MLNLVRNRQWFIGFVTAVNFRNMGIKINWIDLNEQQPNENQYILCYSENTGVKMDTYEFSKDGVHWFYGNEKGIRIH